MNVYEKYSAPGMTPVTLSNIAELIPDLATRRQYVQERVNIKPDSFSEGLIYKKWVNYLNELPTYDELNLVSNQKKYIEDLTTTDSEEQALKDKQAEYYTTMTSDNPLTAEEEADFESEYEAALSSLQSEYDIKTEKAGATQMASLVGRGIFETTTGINAVADTQQEYASALASDTTALQEASQTSKSNYATTKKQLAQQGYSLLNEYFQTQNSNALSAATNLQSYYAKKGQADATTALNTALINQATEQAEYNKKMALWSGITGLGTSLAAAGATAGIGSALEEGSAATGAATGSSADGILTSIIT
jgi:hypothetical protein